MRDKHIKTWLFIFVGTLTVASGAASFFAQQKTLYKGLEPLQWNFSKASVLTVDEIQPAQPIFSPQAEIKKSAESSQEQTAASEETPAEPSFEPVSSPCGADEKPVIKNSQIAGCTKENLSAETCESQGRFTYTGEDRPGLLYGMCIDCLTTEFVQYGNKCN